MNHDELLPPTHTFVLNQRQAIWVRGSICLLIYFQKIMQSICTWYVVATAALNM
jgi:hypothetical protein